MVTAKATPQEVDGFGWWLLVVASTASRTSAGQLPQGSRRA